MSRDLYNAQVKQSLEKFSVARVKAKTLAPFMMEGIYALILWPKEGLRTLAGGPTAVTKDGVMLFDPESCSEDKFTLDTAVYAYFHEAEHLVRGHHARFEASGLSDPRRANIAGDCEIADDLDAMRLVGPAWRVTPTKYGFKDGETMERYYELLGQPHKQPTPDTKHACCGSGAGHPLPHEDEIEMPPGVDPELRSVQIENARNEVASAIKSGGFGNVSAGLKRWAAEYNPTKKIPWEMQLRAASRRAVAAYKAGGAQSTYTAPNRRQGGLGWGSGAPVLASYQSPLPVVALVEDTSGSRGGRDFAQTTHEAKAILKAVGGSLLFMSCDAAVGAAARVTSANRLDSLRFGGGGTDFRPAFSALEKWKKGARPNVIVFATDGYGTYPEFAPKWCKTIWLMNTPYRPPWGTVIRIE